MKTKPSPSSTGPKSARAADAARRTARSASSKPVSAASPLVAGPASGGIEDIREAVSRLKRERILATAVELFHKNGLNNTTLEAVAERMNVTKQFIYSHFKSKNELLAEICAQGIRAALEALNRVVASNGTATEKVRALTRAFMLAVIENQGPIAIYTREQKQLSREDNAAIDDMRREFDHKLCAMLQEGVETGEFAVDDVQLASLAIGGIVSWSYVWYRPSGRLDPEETAERIANLVLAMVNAKPARRSRAQTASAAVA
jgi:TetR/AcrR family transcriptional regulator, cholesterol catabolism regulator